MTDIDTDAIRQRMTKLESLADQKSTGLKSEAYVMAVALAANLSAADVPDLLAKVDELTAERDLNGDLLDGAARALGIDLEDPDVHYAFTIPTKVAELTAALAKSRAQAATYANEIGTLTAENARLRQQRDEQQTVIAAAKAWRWSGETADGHRRAEAALMAAIDALPKTEATR